MIIRKEGRAEGEREALAGRHVAFFYIKPTRDEADENQASNSIVDIPKQRTKNKFMNPFARDMSCLRVSI